MKDLPVVKGCKVLLFAVLLASCLTVAACSGSGEEKKADRGVDKMTKDATEVIVKKIKSPLDAARMTKSLGDKHLEEIDKGVHESE